MYEHLFNFFGLRENPFHVSPDPRFYFSTRAHDTALTELAFGIETRQGFIVLTGEAGTGKTTVLNHFMNWLHRSRRSTSYVFHSQLRPVELFELILRDFGLPWETHNRGELLATLQHWLIQRHAMGDSPVLIIDEAQSISVRTLDRLRLLLNLETPGSKLLQIVLAGQPELEEKLRRPELRQLRQRVMFRCNLLPLSMEETSRYVKSRLAGAGATNVDVFSQESIEAMHMYARGIPRTVNVLCEHALIAGYAQEVKVISPDIIRSVAADFDLTTEPAVGDEREAAIPFGRLVPFRPEERPPRVAVENTVADTAAAEEVTAEAASVEAATAREIPQQEPELVANPPALVVKETISLAPPPPEPLPEPVAATTPTLVHQVVNLMPKPVEHPVSAPQKKALPVGWQGPSLRQQFLRYWKTLATAAHHVLAPILRPTRHPVLAPQKKESLAAWQGASLRQRVLSNWKAFATATHHILAPVLKPTRHPVLAPQKKELPVRWQGESRLHQRFVRYWKDVKDSFLRDWDHFMSAHGLARRGSARARVASLQKNVMVPMARWLRQPASSAARRSKNSPARAAIRKQR